MAAFTDWYVDPSLAADSGIGTSGDPYGDLQYALDQKSHDATNGTRFNIKAGTDEVLASTLSLATYGTTTFTQTAPLVFQGYTTAAGDGGIGGIDGNNGNFSIMTFGGADSVCWIDLHLHNTGSASILILDDDIRVLHCELDTTTASAIDVDNDAIVFNNYFHNIGVNAVKCLSRARILYNYIEDETNDVDTAIACTGQSIIMFNILNLDGASSSGITEASGQGAVIMFNSIYGPGSTGDGIKVGTGLTDILMNNAIEGYNGTNGTAIELTGSAASIIGVLGGNTVGGSADEAEGAVGDHVVYRVEDVDDRGAATIFTDPAANDFTPVDEGSMKEGALPATFGPNAP